MAEWQPIETAPKDGTRVLLAGIYGGIGIGFYGPKYSTYGVNYGDAWGYGTNWSNTFGVEPTHWTPLPNPPETEKKGAE